MIRAAATIALLAGAAWAEPDLPSGLAAEPFDRLIETQPDGERWLILRYIAPAVAALGYEAVAGDLDLLCATDGLDQAGDEPDIAQVVIVLMDRPVPRGTPDPDATQFIGAYRVDQGGCEWE